MVLSSHKHELLTGHFLESLRSFNDFVYISFTIISILLTIQVHPRIIKDICDVDTTGNYFGMLIIYYFCVLLAGAVSVLFVMGIKLILSFWIHDFLLFNIVTSFIFVVFFVQAFMLSVVFVLSSLWVFGVVILMAALRIAELVIYRIAVNEKGPVLAVAGLCTGIGSVLKALA
jgi:hypothetical protein